MLRARSVSEQKRLWLLRTLAALTAFTAAAVLLAPPANAQRSARVLHRNIAQLVDKADVIFLGEVISANVEPHPTRRITTVVVRLSVREVLKGQPGAEFTFRQYLWDPHDAKGKLGYGAGQQYVLLMRNPNPDGLTSPSGMEQGRFSVTTDTAGNKLASNAYNNVGLMRNIDQTTPKLKNGLNASTLGRMAQHGQGAISYEDLRDLIRGAIAAGN